MDTLVRRLAKLQQVLVTARPDRTLDLFRSDIDRGYLSISFPETSGGTELGVRLESGCDLSGADWERATGLVRLVGSLVLDYERVRCHATIELATLSGTGHLEVLRATPPGQRAPALVLCGQEVPS